MDLNPRGLEFARQAGRTRVARASVAAIPFPDATFDVAVAFMSLMDGPQYSEAVRETLRVLRPGGRFCLRVAGPNGSQLPGKGLFLLAAGAAAVGLASICLVPAADRPAGQSR